MAKKILVLFIMSFIFIGSVSAESYYTNNNGVELTEDEYNFIIELYNQNYLENLTQEQYDYLNNNNIFGQQIRHIEYNDGIGNGISTYSYVHETTYKKLQGNYACGTTCSFYATLTWKILPAIRSYDHFGMYGVGTSTPTNIISNMYKNSNPSAPVEYKIQSNGASALFKLPTSASTLVFDLSFNIEKRGSVYISYQHAQSNISKANSKKFTFSHAGYGHVFLFDQPIRQYYDQMGGLTIYLS